MCDFAPRIITIKINPEKIREIIGKGGSMIRKIQEETQTEINVEDDGTVEIAAVSGENSRKAIQWIESLTREVEVGALYLGKVTRLMTFGCFVEILPGKEGLVRIGELADYHVPTVEDVVSVGDEVMVVVTEIDRQGRVNLSPQGGDAAAPRQVTPFTTDAPGSLGSRGRFSFAVAAGARLPGCRCVRCSLGASRAATRRRACRGRSVRGRGCAAAALAGARARRCLDTRRPPARLAGGLRIGGAGYQLGWAEPRVGVTGESVPNAWARTPMMARSRTAMRSSMAVMLAAGLDKSNRMWFDK